jgi:hypothetical protein
MPRKQREDVRRSGDDAGVVSYWPLASHALIAAETRVAEACRYRAQPRDGSPLCRAVRLGWAPPFRWPVYS